MEIKLNIELEAVEDNTRIKFEFDELTTKAIKLCVVKSGKVSYFFNLTNQERERYHIIKLIHSLTKEDDRLLADVELLDKGYIEVPNNKMNKMNDIVEKVKSQIAYFISVYQLDKKATKKGVKK
jgi:hypothetical protein